MNHTKTTTKFTLLSIISIFSISVFIFLFVSIKSINQNASMVLLKLKSNMSDKAHGAFVKKTVSEVLNSKNQIDSYLVDSNNIDVFVNNLESFGKNSGTDIFVRTVENPNLSTNTISVGFSIKGSFSNVVNTLMLISYSQYKVHFKSVYLKADVNQSGDNSTSLKSSGIWQAEVFMDILIAS